MPDRKFSTITRFKTSRWTIEVDRTNPSWKMGPDEEIIARLTTVPSGQWQKPNQFVDCLEGLEGIESVTMIDRKGDGQVVTFI